MTIQINGNYVAPVEKTITLFFTNMIQQAKTMMPREQDAVIFATAVQILLQSAKLERIMDGRQGINVIILKNAQGCMTLRDNSDFEKQLFALHGILSKGRADHFRFACKQFVAGPLQQFIAQRPVDEKSAITSAMEGSRF